MRRSVAVTFLIITTVLFFSLSIFLFVFRVRDFDEIAIPYVSRKLGVDLSGEVKDYYHMAYGFRGDKDVLVEIELTPESVNRLLDSTELNWSMSPYIKGIEMNVDVLFASDQPIGDHIHGLLKSPGYHYYYRDDYAISHNLSVTFFDQYRPYAVDLTICVLDVHTNTLYYREWNS
jgi:hypothetical protein